MKYRLSFLLLLVAVAVCHGQSEYQFTSGLAVSRCHRYGREAIVTDQLAYRMYSGQLQKPEEGKTLFQADDGRDMVWTRIEADSTGRFRGEAIANGYIYLTYNSPKAQSGLVNITGSSMFFFNREPRGGDIYSDGWMNIPVTLNKGPNEILIRCGNFSRFQGVRARITFPKKPLSLSTEDSTLPHIVIGESKVNLPGALVVINGTAKTATGLTITSSLNGRTVTTSVPDLPANSIRKVAFYFNPQGVEAKGEYSCLLQLKSKGNIIDQQSLTIAAVTPDEHHSYTFISAIDGSVQYYSVAPHSGEGARPALFLSVHGAGVQAIGQARAYKPKDWGVLVAPTNRRPRGFNWEDWGRIDALEVLSLATKRFNPDPSKIYLTGHSMGGHGTWFLGATYPDKWAAIAPCAGYPTLTAYGSADGRIPDSARSATEQVLLRASNGSNVIALARNYKPHGVYVFHGDADRTVPVTFARQMRDTLGAFHPDFSYYEYPGGSHWFGNESVDWPPLFDFFKRHTLKADTAVDRIEFTTANPAVSSSFRWASIIQQTLPLEFSAINLIRDKNEKTVRGTTKNVSLLKLDLRDFGKGNTVSVSIDSIVFSCGTNETGEHFFRRTSSGWVASAAPGGGEKNSVRSGTFKEAFNHRMIFVYGTGGNAAEDQWAYNKARFDAEVWYYRGNGAVDVIADVDFDPGKYPDRGVILYGNATTNSAWKRLLANCPIEVYRDRIRLGSSVFEGSDLSIYFTWPRPDSNIASVGVVGGTGLPGLSATEANQYFAAGSGFPDYMIFSLEMLKAGAPGVKSAGFFDNEWKLTGQ